MLKNKEIPNNSDPQGRTGAKQLYHAPSSVLEQLLRVGEGLELDGIAFRILNEHAHLFTDRSFHHHAWFHEEGDAHFLELVAQLLPIGHGEHNAPMVGGHAAFGIVDPSGLDQLGYLLDGQLVSEEVIIHPGLSASPFGTTEEFSVEGPNAFEIGGGEREVESTVHGFSELVGTE